jgi:hypothetical protein
MEANMDKSNGKELFKSKRGNILISQDIIEALFELTYNWCGVDGIYDKYPFSKSWYKNRDINNLPSKEAIHDFLKQFLPRYVK